jgi:hypothetical protein
MKNFSSISLFQVDPCFSSDMSGLKPSTHLRLAFNGKPETGNAIFETANRKPEIHIDR